MNFIFESFDIPEKNKKCIDYSRLLRKPIHKPIVQKYDKTSLNQERTVSALTKEDNFNKFDMPWISNLRVKDNAELARLSQRVRESTVPMAPSFYDEDLSKVQTRQGNIKNSLRLSNVVDVDAKGNTNDLQHLMRPHDKGSPTRSDINFGFGLRKYNSVTRFKPTLTNP
jgi:hypothetical protein